MLLVRASTDTEDENTMCTNTWSDWLWMQGEHVLLMALPVLVVILYYRTKDHGPRPTRTRFGAWWRRVMTRVGPIRRDIRR